MCYTCRATGHYAGNCPNVIGVNCVEADMRSIEILSAKKSVSLSKIVGYLRAQNLIRREESRDRIVV